jgi:hypothetical protein
MTTPARPLLLPPNLGQGPRSVGLVDERGCWDRPPSRAYWVGTHVPVRVRATAIHAPDWFTIGLVPDIALVGD